MSDGARKAGQQIARTLADHVRETAHRAVERTANDIGEVVKSDGKGRVEIILPGVGVAVNETDAYFTLEAKTLKVGDSVAVMAVGNEYIIVGVITG